MTRDAGMTWQRLALPELAVAGGYRTAAWVQTPVFASPTRGATLVSECVGDGNRCTFDEAIERTIDGGKTWTSGSVVHGSPGARFLSDATHDWLPYGCLQSCAAESTLLTTADAGQSWTELALDNRLSPNRHTTRTFEIVTPTSGFATAVTLDGPVGFFRTTDGGRTFTPIAQKLIG